MKERYNIKITDIQLSILSDEPSDFVLSTVAQLDHMISDLTVKNKRCSKLDAALLCALDSLSEKSKNETKIRNLEAQISLYEETIKRLREEVVSIRTNAVLLSAQNEAESAPAPETEPAVQPAPTVEEPSAPVPAEETQPESAAAETAEPSPEQSAEESEPAPLHDAKLRQIEELLRRRSEEFASRPASTQSAEKEDSQPHGSAAVRDDKLREIEELLRRGGKSLSEAVHDAIGK